MVVVVARGRVVWGLWRRQGAVELFVLGAIVRAIE